MITKTPYSLAKSLQIGYVKKKKTLFILSGKDGRMALYKRWKIKFSSQGECCCSWVFIIVGY